MVVHIQNGVWVSDKIAELPNMKKSTEIWPYKENKQIKSSVPMHPHQKIVYVFQEVFLICVYICGHVFISVSVAEVSSDRVI